MLSIERSQSHWIILELQETSALCLHHCRQWTGHDGWRCFHTLTSATIVTVRNEPHGKSWKIYALVQGCPRMSKVSLDKNEQKMPLGCHGVWSWREVAPESRRMSLQPLNPRKRWVTAACAQQQEMNSLPDWKQTSQEAAAAPAHKSTGRIQKYDSNVYQSKSNQPFKKSNKGPMQFEKSQTSSPTELQTFIKRLRNTWQEDPCGNESKRSKSTWPGFMAFLTAKAPGGVRKDKKMHYSDLFHFNPLHTTVRDCSLMGRLIRLIRLGRAWAGHGPGLQRLWEEVSWARPSARLGGPVLAPGTPATKFTRNTPQLKQNTYRIYYRILIESYIDLVYKAPIPGLHVQTCPNSCNMFQSFCKLLARVREATWHRMSHGCARHGGEGGFVDVGDRFSSFQSYKGIACFASQPKHKARRLRIPFCLGSWMEILHQKIVRSDSYRCAMVL